MQRTAKRKRYDGTELVMRRMKANIRTARNKTAREWYERTYREANLRTQEKMRQGGAESYDGSDTVQDVQPNMTEATQNENLKSRVEMGNDGENEEAERKIDKSLQGDTIMIEPDAESDDRQGGHIPGNVMGGVDKNSRETTHIN